MEKKWIENDASERLAISRASQETDGWNDGVEEEKNASNKLQFEIVLRITYTTFEFYSF